MKATPPAARPTLAALAADLAAGRTTSRKLVEDCLFRISHPDGEGKRVFVKVYDVAARIAAEAQDGCLENFSRRGRCHRFKMHTISQVLNPPGEPIDGELPPPFVKRSYWIPGSYAPPWSEKCISFLKTIEKEGLQGGKGANNWVV